MTKRSTKTLAKAERRRDLNAELLEAARDLKAGRWARKTEFIEQRDGSILRRITRADGTVEKQQRLTANDAPVSAARARTGLSQTQFARLLGVSARTLQQWEQGRTSPSGAARTLLRLAWTRPKVLRELNVA